MPWSLYAHSTVPASSTTGPAQGAGRRAAVKEPRASRSESPRGGRDEGEDRGPFTDRALPSPPSAVRHASVTGVLVGDRERVPRGATSSCEEDKRRGGGGGEDIDKQSGGDCVRRSRGCSVHGGPLPLVPLPSPTLRNAERGSSSPPPPRRVSAPRCVAIEGTIGYIRPLAERLSAIGWIQKYEPIERKESDNEEKKSNRALRLSLR